MANSMKLLRSLRSLKLVVRHQMTGAMARSEVSRRGNQTSPIPLPVEISERLGTLKVRLWSHSRLLVVIFQTDVINAILGGSIPEHCGQTEEEAYPSSFTSSSTGNLHEMASYYFNQGGKLLRPQICLLMGNACNQKAMVSR